MPIRFLRAAIVSILLAAALATTGCGDDNIIVATLFGACGVTPNPDFHETDNTIAEADLQGNLAETTSHSLTMDDGTDIFRINVGSLDLGVTLTFTDAQGDLDLYVLDSNLNVVASSKTTTDNESTLGGASTGVNYLVVQAVGCPPGSTAQSYTLSWADGI